MKKISFAIACIVVLSLCAGSAAAQQLATATIPFGFSVHDKTFPAGAYQVRYLGSSMVRLEKVEGGEGVTLVAPSAIRQSSGMDLKFRQYGEQRFLAGMADKTLGYEADFPRSNTENNLRKWRKNATIVALRAGK